MVILNDKKLLESLMDEDKDEELRYGKLVKNQMLQCFNIPTENIEKKKEKEAEEKDALAVLDEKEEI